MEDATISTQETTAPSEQQPSEAAAVQDTPQLISGKTTDLQKREKSTKWIIVGGIFVATVLGGTLYLFIQRNVPENQDAREDQATAIQQTVGETGFSEQIETGQTVVEDAGTGWETHSSTQYGIRIKYPSKWRVTQTTDTQTAIHEGEDPYVPVPYQLGRIVITSEGATERTDIGTWFSEKYPPPEEGHPVTPSYPSIESAETLETQSGVALLKIPTFSLYSKGTYYVISSGKVVSFSINLTDNEGKDAELEDIYSEVINSLELL